MPFSMRWPTEQGTRSNITQLFGARPEFYQRFGFPGHEGLDFGVPERSKIFAVADGVISRIDLDGNNDRINKPYGNQCRITHKTPDGEFITVYAHLTEVLVSLGQTVRAGDQIALSGNTGNSEGAHLHLTLKKTGATRNRQTNYQSDVIDPFPFLEPFGTRHGPNPVIQTQTPIPPTPPQPVTPPPVVVINMDLGGNQAPVQVPAQPPAPAPAPVGGTIGQVADMLRFVGDVTIPDNTVMKPGQTFVKTWRIRNNGPTSWAPGYALAYFQDARLGTIETTPLPQTRPNDTVDVSVMFTAPSVPGTYRSVWRARNAAGQFFGAVVFVVIKVE